MGFRLGYDELEVLLDVEVTLKAEQGCLLGDADKAFFEGQFCDLTSYKDTQFHVLFDLEFELLLAFIDFFLDQVGVRGEFEFWVGVVLKFVQDLVKKCFSKILVLGSFGVFNICQYFFKF